jgi:hypothetical protein
MEKEALTLDQFESLTPQGQPKALSIDEFEALMPRIEQKAKSRGFLDTVKYFLGEGILKPLARGTEAIPGRFEEVKQMNISKRQDMIKKMLADEGAVFGADISKRTPEQAQKIAELNKIVDNFDKIIETSKRMQGHWDELSKSGIEAPSEEFLMSSPNPLDKNFSFTRLAALGAESFPMLAMGAAISGITKSPSTGAMFISMFDAAEEYNIAREKGLSEEELNLVFASDLLVLTALETVPLTTFMKGGKIPLQMFKVGLQEGGEEVLQNIWKNSVAAIGYDETRKVTEGLIESFLAGFISGGVLGTFSPPPEVQKKLEVLEEKGVDTDKMIDTVGRQVIDNAEKIVDNFSEKVGPESVQLPEEEVSQNGNQENVEGVPGQEQVREEPVKANIVEEGGSQTAETGGILQAQEQVATEEWDEVEVAFDKSSKGEKLTLNEKQAMAEIEVEYEKERKGAVDEIRRAIEKKIAFESGEEFALIPRKLFAKKGSGVALDSLATELEASLVFLGYEANSDGLREFIYNEIGTQGEKGILEAPRRKSAKKTLSEINKLVKERDAGIARIIRIVEKRLGKPLTVSGAEFYKSLSHEKRNIEISEEEALKIKLRAMQKASKQGEKAGVKKERNRLYEIIKNKKVREEEFNAVKKMFDFIDKVATSGIPLEYADAINEIKESIGFYREGKKRVTSARNILSRGKAAALDPEISNDVSELEKINAADMDVNDLIEVYDVIQQIYHSGLHQNKFMIANKMANFLETVKAGVGNIVKFGKNLDNISTIESPPKGHGKWSKELLQKYFAEHRRPEAMLEEFDGFKEGENYNTMFVPLNEASLEKERGLDKAKERLSIILSEIDIFNLLHKKEKVAGIERKLSRDEMVFIYANTLNPQNMAHLKGSGISEEMIADVTNKLTENEKKVVNNIVQYFSELYDSIDAVYSKLKGKHLPRVEGVYFPIQNLANVGDIEQIELQITGFNEFMRTGVAKGFTEARDIKSDKAFKQFSFMNTVFRHINQVEHYKAFALPLRDASKYFKHPSIKAAIVDNYGAPTYDVLNSWLENIARGRDAHLGSFWDDVVLALRTNYVVSVLGGNLSTVIKQPVSFTQGMGYIGKRAALNGLAEFISDPEKATKFCKEKSTQMKHRAFAQERELQDIARGRSVETIFKQNPRLLDYFKNPGKLILLKQFIKEGSMKPILWADEVTVTALWLGEYRKQMNVPGMSEQTAIAAADKAIRRTQPQSGTVHLPAVFQSDPVRKLFTLFKNQPNQDFNLIYDAIAKYGKNKKNFKATAELADKLMIYWILSSFIYGMATRKRMPEDKKEIALDLAQGLIGGMVGISNIYDKVVYPWGSDNMLGALYDDAARIINTKDVEKKLMYGIDLVGTVSGVPAYSPIKRLFTRESLKTKLFGGERRKRLKPASF